MLKAASRIKTSRPAAIEDGIALSSTFLRTSIVRPFSNSSLALLESVCETEKTACSPRTLATNRSAVGETPALTGAVAKGEGSDFEPANCSDTRRAGAATGLPIGFPHPLQNEAISGFAAPQELQNISLRVYQASISVAESHVFTCKTLVLCPLFPNYPPERCNAFRNRGPTSEGQECYQC
jgi:hypothetical protein